MSAGTHAGHSSWAASGLGYTSWFLFDVLDPFDSAGHPWRLAVSMLPVLGALTIGITRYVDYWHHWSDILAGLLLGGVISWLTYRQQRQRVVAATGAPPGEGSSVNNRGMGSTLDGSESQPLWVPSLPV